MKPIYVYGLIGAGVEIPDDLPGLGPSGVVHGKTAAIAGALPADRPLDVDPTDRRDGLGLRKLRVADRDRYERRGQLHAEGR